MLQDFENRIVLVVRNDLEGWQIANTIAHMSAYLGNRLKDRFGIGVFGPNETVNTLTKKFGLWE